MARTDEERRAIVLEHDALPRAERREFVYRLGLARSTVPTWRQRLGLNPTACRCGAPLEGRERSCAACRRQAEADGHRRRAYGLTPDGYAEMFAAQGGLCAACGQPPPTEGHQSQRSLHVDHDHRTGRVRGLLCHPCNLALGYAHESVARLLALADYLSR